MDYSPPRLLAHGIFPARMLSGLLFPDSILDLNTSDNYQMFCGLVGNAGQTCGSATHFEAV